MFAGIQSTGLSLDLIDGKVLNTSFLVWEDLTCCLSSHSIRLDIYFVC